MNTTFSKRIDSLIIYLVTYTAFFITFYLTMPYILPFILGTIIALISQPVINYFVKNLRMRRGPIAIITVLMIFGVVIAILSIIIAKIISELISLSAILPSLYLELKGIWYKYLDIAASYIKTLNPAIVDSIKGSANNIFSGSFTAAMFIVNLLIKALLSLPGIIMVFLFTLLSAVYISIDYPRIKNKIFSLFSKEDGSKAKHIVLEANKMLLNYLRAYLILISLTFIETLIGTSILNIRYALLISLITSISDLLPILGPGTVLVPTAIVYLLGGNYVQGIGIFITYIVIVIVRQILEPKIVSSSLGVYPLAIIIAIFVGIKSYGFIGMIFSVFLVVFYVILSKVGLI